MKSSQQYAVLPIIALSLSAVVLSACNGSSNDTTDTADSGGQTPLRIGFRYWWRLMVVTKLAD